MPKQFGFAARGLAVVVLATGLVGCRTASTQLASMPGFGWLDRGEEGWANYEPAPPKPSASSEPTSGGGAASNIASKSDPFSKPVSDLAKTDVNARFDTDRYMPKSNTTSDASTPEKKTTFGDYASAYGKYSPPKSLDERSKSLAQTGPYDAGSLAATDSTPKFGGGKPYVGPSSADPATTEEEKAPFGYVANNRFDASSSTTPEAQSTPTFIADSNSRFGADAYKTASTASNSYTPPGFPTTPKAEPLANRFGAGFNNATQAATEQTNQFANDATNKLSNAAGSFTNNVTATGANALNNAKSQVSGSVASSVDAVTNKFNNAVKSAPQQFGNSLSNADNGGQGSLTNVAQNAMNSASSAASTARSQFGNAVAGVNNAATEAASTVADAKDYASGYQQAASDAVKNVQNRFGNAASQAPAFGDPIGNVTAAAQNVTQDVSNQVQNYAQGATNTVQQNLGSAYQQVKSSATTYGNQALNNATQTLSNAANSGVDQARDAIQGYASAGKETINNVMQNVSSATQSPPMHTTYPSTSTPNPFLKPPKMPTTTAPLSTPPPSAPAMNPTNFNPAPSIQRNPAPFLPGSTSNLQGKTTVRKQDVELANATEEVREPLQLAVGDQYQFPRSFR